MLFFFFFYQCCTYQQRSMVLSRWRHEADVGCCGSHTHTPKKKSQQHYRWHKKPPGYQLPSNGLHLQAQMLLHWFVKEKELRVQPAPWSHPHVSYFLLSVLMAPVESADKTPFRLKFLNRDLSLTKKSMVYINKKLSYYWLSHPKVGAFNPHRQWYQSMTQPNNRTHREVCSQALLQK